MTVSTTDSQIDYSSGGPSFPIPFKFLRDEDIQPVLTLADGSQVVLTQNVQYTLTGSGNEGGGTLTSAYAQTAINSGALLRIARIMQPTQETDLRNQGRYFAETHERVFDRLTMLIQQALTGVGNSLSLNSLKNRWDFKGLRGVNVGDPIDPKDVANKSYVDTSNAAQDTRIDALSAGLPGTNYAFPWSTTTTTGTRTLTPGFEFASATLYINGIAQTFGKSFAVAGNKILLAQAVPAGTEIYAILGQYVTPSTTISPDLVLPIFQKIGYSAPGQPRPPAKGFWTDVSPGANVHRFRDRLLVGAAADANGADDPGADKTWVGYTSGGLMTYFETRSTFASFADNGVISGAFASRSGDQNPDKGGPCIGVAGLAYNNREGRTAWAGYFTAVKDNDTVMYTHGVEADVANRGSTVDIDPYNMTRQGQTVAAWIRTGGETAESGQAVNPASAAFGVVGSVTSNANAVFRKGLVFAANAIQNDDTGHAPAIVMAKNQSIDWIRDGSGQRGGSIRSDSTISTNRVNLVFNNAGLSFNSVSSGGAEIESFRISGNPTAANFLEVRTANANGRPSLIAQGADANIDLAIVGKGTGGVRLRDGSGAERLQVNSTGLGFFGTTPVAKPVVSGSRGANAALDSLLQALQSFGLITNSTSA